jgi:protein-disulfide isomerase
MRFFDRRLVMTMALSVLLAACGGKAGGAVSTEDMSMGKADAKVTVIEYASASCPHCARWANDVFPAFKAKYVDTGKVRYVYREFLTPPVEMASAGFLLARCAGQDKYFPVLEAIYRNQAEMYESGDIRGGLLRIGQSVGLNEKQFNACISDDEALKALNDRVEKYQRDAEIQGTPTFFFNGERYDKGEMSLAEIDAAYDKAVAAAK